MLELISAEPPLCAQIMDLQRKQSSVSRYGKRKGRGGVPSGGCEEMRNVWQVAGETCNTDVNFNAAAVLTGAMGFMRVPRNDRVEKMFFSRRMMKVKIIRGAGERSQDTHPRDRGGDCKSLPEIVNDK